MVGCAQAGVHLANPPHLALHLKLVSARPLTGSSCTVTYTGSGRVDFCLFKL
jgi:hypothetical protein